MMNYFQRLIFSSAFLGLALGGAAAPARAAERSAFLDLGVQVLMPAGWAGFCERYAGECARHGTIIKEVNASVEMIDLVQRVNKMVNETIKPQTDLDHWNEIDRWDYAEDGAGDCEDYVLVKRRALMAIGIPASSLLVTIVRDEHLDGHAVLTLRTNRGDLILDNANSELKVWWRTPYRFVKIQSAMDPNEWISIGPVLSRPQLVSR